MTNIKVLAHRLGYTETLHDVCVYLLQNKTSWVLYNMAAFYWRIKGEPFQAIECVRRALHHSPRYASSAPLLSSVLKGELKQRSITGCMDRNRIKTRHTAVFCSVSHSVCEKSAFESCQSLVVQLSFIKH